jgi:hypothetical protein
MLAAIKDDSNSDVLEERPEFRVMV